MRAQSIVGQSPGRPKDDFYPTPAGATLALLEVEHFPETVWEPACGNGAISKVLEGAGHRVISTDLIDRGYGEGGRNFFNYAHPEAPTIITNPPYTWALLFLQHAQKIGVTRIAMLLKLAFLEGQNRSHVLERSGLKGVYIFRNRLTMTRNGEAQKSGGMIAFAWYVWKKGYTKAPTIGWVEEVKSSQLPLL